MRGDIAAALTELRAQYDTGADPAVVLADLAEFTHFVTRVKIVPAVADDASLIEVERTRGRAFAEKLSMRVLAAHLADAAQGHRRGAGGRPAGRRRRDGAGADRLCGRSADARRGDPLAVGRNEFAGGARQPGDERRPRPTRRRRPPRAMRRPRRARCSAPGD